MPPQRKNKRTLSPEQVAEKAFPSWKVTTARYTDRPPQAGPDAVKSRGVDAMRRKFLDSALTRQPLADAGPRAKKRKPSEPAKFVTIEPKRPSDPAIGKKVVLVRGGKVKAVQG